MAQNALQGPSRLITAVRDGNLESVKSLLGPREESVPAHVDVNAADWSGCTALMIAARVAMSRKVIVLRTDLLCIDNTSMKRSVPQENDSTARC